jgi:nitronate monooxygenase
VLEVPIVGAPLAGGPSTPALAAAVSEAGGLGFLAAGYKTAAAVEADLREARTLTGRPLGLNLFVPAREPVDEHALAAYVERMRPEAVRYGARPGEPTWTDDDWDAKLALAARTLPEVVSFTFGCPDRETIAALRAAGCRVWCTVTSVDEAREAAGVDALVVQGAEAGGHQGSFRDRDEEPQPLRSLLARLRQVTDLPLVATGGIGTAADANELLAAGAFAVQIGTALLRTDEAGTAEPYRRALEGDADTRLTRAFTGRRARGIVNRFLLEHDAFAPRAYPQVHNLTSPIRAAARSQGDADGINLWAGTAYRLAECGSAAELVERWGAQLPKPSSTA